MPSTVDKSPLSPEKSKVVSTSMAPLHLLSDFAAVEWSRRENRQIRSSTLSGRTIYLLRSLIRCSCGAVMTPKGAMGRNGKYHYYTGMRKGMRG